jgi:hypothetical protein
LSHLFPGEDQMVHAEGNSDWLVTRAVKSLDVFDFPGSDKSYVTSKTTITIRRQSTFATHLFVAPAVTLCLVIPTVFLLPPESTEKMTLGTTW